MIKIKGNKNINLIIIILVIMVLVLGSLLFYQYKKANTSFLESITILGNEFKLKPGIYVYEFTIDNPKIKAISGGCEMPYNYKISKMFANKTNGESGIHYFVDGEDYAYFDMDFMNKDNDKMIAKYYFSINFTSPLKVAEGC